MKYILLTIILLYVWDARALSLASSSCDIKHVVSPIGMYSDKEVLALLPNKELGEKVKKSSEISGTSESILEAFFEEHPNNSEMEEAERKINLVLAFDEIRGQARYYDLSVVQASYIFSRYQLATDQIEEEMGIRLLYWPRNSGACNVSKELSLMVYNRFMSNLQGATTNK